ncbi:MAG: cytochrome P450 [Myxococcota bacterium]
MRWVNGQQRRGEPPLVPGSLPFLGAALTFGRDALSLLQECRREHGDVFTLYVAGRRMTFVCDTQSYLSVLRSETLKFEPFTDQVMERAFDYPCIRDDLDVETIDSMARRRLKGPDLADISAGMSAEVLRLLEQDPRVQGASGEFDLYRLIWDVVFAAGTRVIFGDGVLESGAAQEFQDFDEKFAMLVAGLPRVTTRKARGALRSLADTFAEIGAEPSAWMRDRQSLIGGLPASKRGRTQVAVLWATHANTIPSIFWTVAHVLSSKEATAAVVGEIEEKLGDAAGKPLSRGQLDGLHLIDSAAREALRLGAGSLIVRKAVEPTQLETRSGTWSIREGDQVCLAPQLTHYDPEVFERPEEFVIDRFMKGARFEVDGERTAFAFAPFGAGKHTCPGRFFAINEIKTMVVSLLGQLRFDPISEPLPGFQRGRSGLGIFPPERDLRLRWTRRSDAK